jgi:tRNA A37 methylthiotransferase MiaB
LNFDEQTLKMTNHKKNKVYISLAFACPLRVLDSGKLRNYFSLNNFEIVDSYQDADYYIYVTCSATQPIVKSELETIKKLKNSSCDLIVMGCLPGANQEDLANIFTGKAVSTKNIEDIDKLFPEFRIKFKDIPETYNYDYGDYVFIDVNPDTSVFSLILKYGLSLNLVRYIKRQKEFKNYSNANSGKNILEPRFIKICSGCANNCTYCNIREAVGKVKSKSIELLTGEYAELLNQGNRLFHFLAEDICSYGLDIKSSLQELLISLQETDDGYHTKWSLEGVHPSWLIKHQNELLPFIKSKKVWEITLSVEHASDRILELMNRHYKIDDLKQVLKTLRKTNPSIKINAMFILGFPTETEEDFNEVINLLKIARFECVTLSAYSEFTKRASSKILPKVPENIVQKRLRIANHILQKLKTPMIRGDK